MSLPLSTPASRYTIIREIAAGGMATVYLGRLAGPGGFSRSVAIKRPHPHVARHPEFRAMLLDEGRLAASISHPNVVSTLDVVAEGDDLFLVMEYVPGATLAQLQRATSKRDETIPASIASAIVRGVLHGLEAVHGARDEHGEPLGIVHRDISPQNILVGHDGVARILDFGVAKAARRLQVTRDGQLKGKIAYMAPEQMQGNATARTDVYATSIVLWEALTGRRLFTGEDEVAVFSKALAARVTPPSQVATRGVRSETVAWTELDKVVLRGLARDPAGRFTSAKEMAAALEECVECAAATEVAAWLERKMGDNAQPGDAREPGAPSVAPATDETSSMVTIKDVARGSVATLTEPAAGELALQVVVAGEASSGQVAVPAESAVTPAAQLSPRRHRRRALVALGGIAGSILVAAFAIRSHPPPPPAGPVTASSVGTNATVTEKLDQVATPAETATASAATAPVAGGSDTAAGISEESTAGAPGRAKPPPKNRVERARRVPLVSQTIDVSHAIDERH